MSYTTLETREDGGVVHLRLNRPSKRNALSAEMIAELTDFAQTVGAARTTRAVSLTGAGDVFCAGGDLEWMKAQIEAERLGVVAKVVPEAGLASALEQETAPYLRVAPGAVAEAKRLARALGPKIDEAVIAATIEALADVWDGEDAAEGIGAFLQKRAPRWAGKP